MDKIFDAFLAVVITGFIMWGLISIGESRKKDKPEIKHCEPLSIHQSVLYVEKRQMFLNQIANANKKNKPSLQDSARKYTKLLMNCDSAKFNEDMFKTEEL